MSELLETLHAPPGGNPDNELDDLLWPQVEWRARASPAWYRSCAQRLGTRPGLPHHQDRLQTGYAFCADVSCLPSATAFHAKIELIWGKLSLPLTDGEYFAGRDEACDLVIDRATVSRRHARIAVISGIAAIEDLREHNGRT